MSSQWRTASGKKTGSTRYWRRVREAIFREHGYICYLCHQGISPSLPARHPLAAQVHHVMGATAGMYDRRFLRPVHRGCNAAVGNPSPVLPTGGVAYDPPSRVMTNW